MEYAFLYVPLTFILLYPQNAELFAFTYGALVVQLIQDYEDYSAVNAALARMGSSIGTRLVEDFLARSALGRCADFRETGEVVAKVRLYCVHLHFQRKETKTKLNVGKYAVRLRLNLSST